VTIVIDANALVALIASEPDGPAVSRLIEQWTAEERELHAPASGVTRSPMSSRVSMQPGGCQRRT